MPAASYIKQNEGFCHVIRIVCACVVVLHDYLALNKPKKTDGTTPQLFY